MTSQLMMHLSFRSRNPHLLLVMSLSLFSASCAQLNSIHRTDKLPKDRGHAILVDAKQRAILSLPEFSEGATQLRICSEAAPDVFSVLAASLAGEASLAEGADPLAKNVAAKLSASISESASTIERTQTINMLRESMYRTCERYLSGAIGRTELIVQSARDQRAMVAILAIEQITGVSRAQAIALATVADSSVGGRSEESIKILAQAQKDAHVAKADANEKRKTADNATPKKVDCDIATSSGDSTHASKKALCDQARVSEKSALAKQQFYESLRLVIENRGVTSASSQGSFHAAAQTTAESSNAVAAHVVDIVKQIGDFDEIGMTCVVIFRLIAESALASKDLDKEIKEACMGRVIAEAELQQKRMEMQAADIEIHLRKLNLDLDHQVQVIWHHILNSGSPDGIKLQRLFHDTGTKILGSDLSDLVSSRTADEFKLRLSKIGPLTRVALAKRAQE